MEEEPKNLDISSLENIERPQKKSHPKTYNLLLDVELEILENESFDSEGY